MEMPELTAVECLGILAGVFILVSFYFRDIKRVRYINSVGCILFIIYSIFIDSWAVLITNAGILGIHIYHLFFYIEKKSKDE